MTCILFPSLVPSENPDNTNAVTVEMPSTETSYDIANLTPETSYTVEVSGLQKSITDLCLTVQSEPARRVFTTGMFLILLNTSRLYCLKRRDQPALFRANTPSKENYYMVVPAS